MSDRIVINNPEITAQTNVLQNASGTLKDIGDRYKGRMDAVSSEWHGNSGKSFAEAAGRVESGYIVNKSVLDQMINDAKRAQSSMNDQDAQSAKSVDFNQII